ncbi:MAG TPA: BatD family protein [Polyangiaceae bacterium]|nr:BatD family protein [Polyangiaceae bacterium]
MKRLLGILLLAVATILAPLAFAEEPPQISASIQPNDVLVGEAFSVTMSVTVDSNAPQPSDPKLTLPSGLRASPPSISTQTQISFGNGGLSRRSGISATWQVVATQEGVFTLGPPSVSWSGRRLQARALRVTVHPAGAPRARRPQSQNPFDPFGMFPQMPGFLDPPPEPAPAPAPDIDPELSLDAPLDSKVFLRSVVDQKSPVVGEQVTFTVYLYSRVASIELSDPHEPAMPDFFRRELMSANTQYEAKVVSVGGLPWRVQPIFKVALFPLKSGHLPIGPMQFTVLGGRGSGITNTPRESQALMLNVGEPPSKGRPVGYQIGDVGAYTLGATTEPRAAQVGGAVAVSVTLAGIGNVPNAVRVPMSSSFEWLEPQTRENFEIENGKIRGSRTFSYIVRPKAVGEFDLGEISLSFWNPAKKAYEVARATLGKVQVAADPTQSAAKEPAVVHDPWAALAKPRGELGSYPRISEPPTETRLYWLGLLGTPLAVVVGSMGTQGFSRLRDRLASRKKSAGRGIELSLVEARAASKRADRAALAGAIDRALYLAIERATGLKARALLITEIPGALEARKVPRDLAALVEAVLLEIETLRFAPDAASASHDLLEKAAAVVRRLSKLTSKQTKGS